jgi:hypothetical protein
VWVNLKNLLYISSCLKYEEYEKMYKILGAWFLQCDYSCDDIFSLVFFRLSTHGAYVVGGGRCL